MNMSIANHVIDAIEKRKVEHMCKLVFNLGIEEQTMNEVLLISATMRVCFVQSQK